MDLGGFRDWLDAYFHAWISNEPADVEQLFTEDAVYWVGPFAEPRRGRNAIVDAWVSGEQEDVEYTYQPIAVEGDTGVAHWNVSTRSRSSDAAMELDGILLIGFATDGRCREHREWFARRELPEG